MLKSPHADRIAELPFRHHRGFANRMAQLCADPEITFKRAVEVLCADMKRMGLTELDLEMADPLNRTAVRFEQSSAGGSSDRAAEISHHVARILEVRR